MILPKKPQILYAPMLATFGGGSVNGFSSKAAMDDDNWVLYFGENNNTARQNIASPIGWGECLKYNDNQNATYLMWDTNITISYQGAQFVKIEHDGTATDLGHIHRSGGNSWEPRTFSVTDSGRILAVSESGGDSYFALYNPNTNSQVDAFRITGYQYTFCSDIYSSGGNEYYLYGGRTINATAFMGYGSLGTLSLSTPSANRASSTDEYYYDLLHDAAVNGIVTIGYTNASQSGGTQSGCYQAHAGGYSSLVGNKYISTPYGGYTSRFYGGELRGGNRNCYSDSSRRRLYACGYASDNYGYTRPMLATAEQGYDFSSTGAFFQKQSGVTGNNAGYWTSMAYEDVKSLDKVYLMGRMTSGEPTRSSNGNYDGVLATYSVNGANLPTLDSVIGIKQVLNGSQQNIRLMGGKLDSEGYMTVTGVYTSNQSGSNQERVFVYRVNPANPTFGTFGPLEFFDASNHYEITNGGGNCSSTNSTENAGGQSFSTGSSHHFNQNYLQSTSFYEM